MDGALVRQDSLCRRGYAPAVNLPNDDGGEEALCDRHQCGAAADLTSISAPLSGIVGHIETIARMVASLMAAGPAGDGAACRDHMFARAGAPDYELDA